MRMHRACACTALLNESSGQRAAPGALSATNAVAASRTLEGVADSGRSPGTSSGGSCGNGGEQGVSGSDGVRKRFLLRDCIRAAPGLIVSGVRTEFHEIAEDVFRISIYVEPADLVFNQFLIVAEQPFHCHCGHRQLVLR